MTLDERIDKALALRSQGANCAQAVACAFSDCVDVDEKTIFRAAEGFGHGMGDMEATCGAVSGAVLLAGLHNSRGIEQITKASTYQLTKQIVADFAAQNGSLVCRDLKGVDTGKPLRACPDCIRDACRLAAKIIFQNA